MNWNCSLVWKLNPTATCEIRDQPCQMPWSLWLPVADSATSLMWHELQQHFQSFFSFFFFFLNTNSSVPLTTYETAAADGFIRTHSLGPGAPDGVHDGIHVEVALTGGSWADADSLVRHLHVNLRRNICVNRASQQRELPASASIHRTANPRASLSSPLSLNTH